MAVTIRKRPVDPEAPIKREPATKGEHPVVALAKRRIKTMSEDKAKSYLRGLIMAGAGTESAGEVNAVLHQLRDRL